MSQAVGGALTTQIQQTLAYWRTRIEAFRSQWLGKLGLGGLISLPKTSALAGFGLIQPTVKKAPARMVTASARTQRSVTVAPQVTARVGVPGERYDMTQKILVPEERYDFTYKTRRVGTPGERYDFTY
jgi:hypothetical protein